MALEMTVSRSDDFEGQVRIVDIQYITDEYRKITSNVVTKFFNYMLS